MLPLDGIRVLDLSRLLPGGYCTMVLADLGAEVIKVEEPQKGDYIRLEPPFAGDESIAHLTLNRNKTSVTLNLKDERARQIFYRLVEASDIIVESFRPGIVKRLEVDYQTVNGLNPRIIYCSISGYGQSGPYRDLPGHDLNYVGLAGVLGAFLEFGEPVVQTATVADIGGGSMPAIIAILTALIAREKTGRGQYIDISMLDGAISWMSSYLAGHLKFREAVREKEVYKVFGTMPCYRIYKTKDGKYITIGCLERRFWENLCKALNREDLIDHQFATGKRGRKVVEVLEGIFREKGLDEWMKTLIEHDVCCGAVHKLEEVMNDPQVLHRRMTMTIDHPTLGKAGVFRIPMIFSEIQPTIRIPPPTLGQHTEEVLLGLGYEKSGVEELRKAGCI